MLSCKDIVRIVSADEKISWARRWEVRLHIAICPHCARYFRQLGQIRSSWQKLVAQRLEREDDAVRRLEAEAIRKFC
jgi:anti-sigma factor RsiW